MARILKAVRSLGTVTALLAVTSWAMAALPQPKAPQGAAPPAVEKGPAPVSPAVVSLPTIPSYPGEARRTLATPRARVVLGPRVSDPSEIVQRSGRRGCVFSFRSIVAGVVEFLFPGLDFFRRGDPLFRVYDPEILTDIAAAEQAMQNYDIKPLLIARTPRRARPASRTTRAPSSTGPQTPVAEPPRTAPAPRSKPVPKPAPKVRSTRPAAPKPAVKTTARLKPSPPVPRIDLTPYEDALTQAQAAANAAHSALAQAQEDFDAKKRLLELGALSQQSLDASAETLRAASMRQSDTDARVATARELLTSAKEKNAQAERVVEAAAAAQTAAHQEEPAVEVILGTNANAGVEVVRGKTRRSMEAGVEVIRGVPVVEETVQRAPVAAPAPVQPSRPTVAAPQETPRRPARLARQRRATTRRSSQTRSQELVSRRFLPKPKELDRLSEQRWTEYQAPSDGFVLRRSVNNGDSIETGQELLKVINTQWAVAHLIVRRDDAERFAPGTLATISFDDYPGVQFEGWINALTPEENSENFRAEIVVFCRSGYYGTDAFATLQWLALATPLDDSGDVEPVESIIEDTPQRHYDGNPAAMLSFVPESVWLLGVDDADLERSGNAYEGQLQVTELRSDEAGPVTPGETRKRLAALTRWRRSFVDGMVRTVFNQETILTYPKGGEIRRAIERMATGRVTHVPNRCARTVREALGWGLGDAHVWARGLPARGYVARHDGLARPGDILVWPFTFPPRSTQHIGIAVQQNGRLMLMSNLAGRLGTTNIEPGYIAFYKPS